MILGFDVSHWQWSLKDGITGGRFYVPIDYARAIQNDAKYVFLKACDGASDTPFYKDAIRDARAAGLLAAPYVWIYPANCIPTNKQADWWYSRLKDEPLIAIDIEVTEFNGAAVYPNHWDLRNAIEALRTFGYAGKIIVYTGHYYWLAYGSTDPYFAQFPAWLARYSVYPPQKTPPWPKEKIWQCAQVDPAKYGITNGASAVDEDLFDGTDAELETLFGGTPIPPPIGGTMLYGTVITSSLKVRSAPSTGTVIGGLQFGDQVEADFASSGWWHLTKIRGVETTVESWAYEGATKGFIRTDAPPSGSVVVEVYANGALVHSKSLSSGEKVRIDISD